jgi:hypothetical protein
VKTRRGRKARKRERRKHGNFYHNLPTSECKTAVETTKTFCIGLFTSSFNAFSQDVAEYLTQEHEIEQAGMLS